MEKPDPTCPRCQKTAKFLRDINGAVEFWSCEDSHMFVVDKKPPPRITAAAAREAEAAAAREGEGAAARAPATATESPPEVKAP